MPCERPLQSSQSPQNLVHAPEGGALIASGFTARVGRAGGARTRGLVSSGRTLVECRPPSPRMTAGSRHLNLRFHFTPTRGLLAQPGENLVLDPGSKVAARRLLHLGQTAQAAHRCLDRIL